MARINELGFFGVVAISQGYIHIIVKALVLIIAADFVQGQVILQLF